jgi:hypothetical protein
MKLLRILIISLTLVGVCALSSIGQELNCNVVVNADQIQTSERGVFKDMETSLSQFMSTRKWTSEVFAPEEKINCNMIITIDKMPSIGTFSATVQIQAARPIYNTNYESIIFNFADRDWQFEYVESQPLEFNENVYQNNLVSMMAYYAFVIIGIDYDSFGENAGTPYFQKAQNIVNNAQQSNRSGWDSFGSTRNRYWLVENLNNQQMSPLRKGMYQYHRLALDTYDLDQDKSRATILETLKEMKNVKNSYPNSILIVSFMDAKTDELINIFSEGNLQVRKEAFDALTKLDPTQSDKFKSIVD